MGILEKKIKVVKSLKIRVVKTLLAKLLYRCNNFVIIE